MLNLCHFNIIKQWFTTCNTKYNIWWLDQIHDWQTLLTAAIAGIPAALGAGLLWRQINIQKNESKRIRTQQEILAKIRMPHALSNLSEYWQHCFQSIINSNLNLKNHELPNTHLELIMSASPTVDKNTFEAIQKLVVFSQIFESRFKSAQKISTCEFNQQLLIDIALLDFYTDNLYEFARFETDQVSFISPDRATLSKQIYSLLDHDRILSSSEAKKLNVESALNRHFKKNTNKK